MSVREYAELVTQYGEVQAFAAVRHELGFEAAELVARRWYRYLLECEGW